MNLDKSKMAHPLKIAVFVSGRGSNMQAIVENAKHYSVALVVSDNPASAGLAWAKGQAIETALLESDKFSSKTELFNAIDAKLKEKGCDFILLAGFMKIVPAFFINAYEGRILNIHPSLLPLFPGLDTHKRVLDAGESEHGCTVHFVDSGVDTGPIIAQVKVPVIAGDSVASLSERVLHREHEIYPWVTNNVASGDISLAGRNVKFSEASKSQGLELGFSLPC